MNPNKVAIFVVAVAVLGTGLYFSSRSPMDKERPEVFNETLGAQFAYLSENGNSSCSLDFKDSISAMPDGKRLMGSCCGPMNLHRYGEQVEGLKKYEDISEIPPDPYDIDTKLAKQMMAHYDDALTPQEQQAYDYAMENSMEKGPCCCKCWRWYVYGGLAKHLIHTYQFTGEQITDVWNLSDGCGGDEHAEHHA